jgi:hypothetical protein
MNVSSGLAHLLVRCFVVVVAAYDNDDDRLSGGRGFIFELQKLWA